MPNGKSVVQMLKFQRFSTISFYARKKTMLFLLEKQAVSFMIETNNPFFRFFPQDFGFKNETSVSFLKSVLRVMLVSA